MPVSRAGRAMCVLLCLITAAAMVLELRAWLRERAVRTVVVPEGAFLLRHGATYVFQFLDRDWKAFVPRPGRSARLVLQGTACTCIHNRNQRLVSQAAMELAH